MPHSEQSNCISLLASRVASRIPRVKVIGCHVTCFDKSSREGWLLRSPNAQRMTQQAVQGCDQRGCPGGAAGFPGCCPAAAFGGTPISIALEEVVITCTYITSLQWHGRSP